MTDFVETIVIGAGVIGLAIARECARRGQEVLVLERHGHFGEETSSRNSEVIHAGIYYPKDTLKARFCVEGKKKLYEYCESHGVPHKNLGKLIVATSDEELTTLSAIRQKAADNGVEDLSWISKTELKAMEPELSCKGALLSPSTGIIDTHQYMLALVGDIETAGGFIAYNSAFSRAEHRGGHYLVQAGENTLTCRNLINSAGLGAQAAAQNIDGLSADHIPTRYLTKGNYYTMNAKSPFKRLIYPVPQSASLGVHVTLDLGGQIRFGPDQEWIEEIDYNVNPNRADAFYEAIRKYWPALPDDSLIPAYSGIRPKIQSPTDPHKDFYISGPSDHGLPGLVNLYGMESPGLTSSLAIGAYVADLL